MYFIFNKENNRFFGGMNGAGRYIFEGFSAFDDCVRCVIFSSEVDAYRDWETDRKSVV